MTDSDVRLAAFHAPAIVASTWNLPSDLNFIRIEIYVFLKIRDG